MRTPISRSEWVRYISSNRAVKSLIRELYADRLHSIICYNYPAIAQLRLHSFAKACGGRGLADVTEWYQRLHPQSIKAIVKNADTGFRMKFANFRMDGLITTSRFLTQFYRRKFKDIVELPTLIDIKENPQVSVSPNGSPKRLFFAGAIEDKRVVAKEVGGLKDRLNWVIELLRDAHALGANFHFDIYGVEKTAYIDFFPEHREILESMTDHVTFHGRKPHAYLLKRLMQSDFSIFMRPDMITTNAGFPTKFSESITCGTPVIVNAFDCLVPFLDDRRNSIVVDRSDPKGSAQKVVDALALPSSEVMDMKLHCLASKAFHPATFRNEVQKLFPEIDRPC